MGNCNCCRKNDSRGHRTRSGPPRDNQRAHGQSRSKKTGGGGGYHEWALNGENADFVAFWDYKPNGTGEIEIRHGDEFVELETIGNVPYEPTLDRWAFVLRLSGDDTPAIGYVPRAYLVAPDELEVFKWNFGAIDRLRAEKILRNTSPGTFLIRSRASSNSKSSMYASPESMRNYALSVKSDRGCRHYKIERSIDRGSQPMFNVAGDSQQFPSLTEMLTDLKGGSAVDILCCELRSPAPKPRPPIDDPLPTTAQDTWPEIRRQRIRVRGLLGTNSNDRHPLHIGVLKRGRPGSGPSRVVAVRQLEEKSKGGLERFLSEAAALKTLTMRSNQFLQVIGVCTIARPYMLLMEFTSVGSLRQYLRVRAGSKRRVSERVMVNICWQIADAMRVMEQQNIVHRALTIDHIYVMDEKNKRRSSGGSSSGGSTESADKNTKNRQQKKKKNQKNKPQRCAVSSRLRVKIGGLGWSTVLKPPMDPIRASGGSKCYRVKWTAPEVLAGHDASAASDVWSYGIAVYEIFTHGREPYSGLTDDSVKTIYIQEKKTIEPDAAIPTKMNELISKCCRYQPHARLSFGQIYMFLDRYYIFE